MTTTKILGVLTMAVFVATGCAEVETSQVQNRVYVHIDSFGPAEPGACAHFVIVPGQKDITPDELQFKEYQADVSRALEDKCFVETDDTNTAEIEVKLS